MMAPQGPSRPCSCKQCASGVSAALREPACCGEWLLPIGPAPESVHVGWTLRTVSTQPASPCGRLWLGIDLQIRLCCAWAPHGQRMQSWHCHDLCQHRHAGQGVPQEPPPVCVYVCSRGNAVHTVWRARPPPLKTPCPWGVQGGHPCHPRMQSTNMHSIFMAPVNGACVANATLQVPSSNCASCSRLAVHECSSGGFNALQRNTGCRRQPLMTNILAITGISDGPPQRISLQQVRPAQH